MADPGDNSLAGPVRGRRLAVVVSFSRYDWSEAIRQITSTVRACYEVPGESAGVLKFGQLHRPRAVARVRFRVRSSQEAIGNSEIERRTGSNRCLRDTPAHSLVELRASRMPYVILLNKHTKPISSLRVGSHPNAHT